MDTMPAFTSRIGFAALVASLSVGCGASTPGADPHDMSAAEHREAASAHEGAANAHSDKYVPAARAIDVRCSESSGGPTRSGFGACWTSLKNPTAGHLEEAKKHQKMAADHRSASQALRDAEASACVGLSDDDRDMSPFAHRSDIASVEALNGPDNPQGAIVIFRALPGMTVAWLQRVVDCHVARNAALGHEVPEMTYCPLVPKIVSAKVTQTSSGFAVTIRSDDAGTAREVLRRAQALRAQ